MDYFPEAAKAIALEIWNKKYRYVKPDGGGDKTPVETWARVAKACALPEHAMMHETWAAAFFHAMSEGYFSPAGRIIAGAGTGRDVTLFNCFVMDKIGDSMRDIFRNVTEAAVTMQAGGGIGMDYSTLRPRGAPVVGVGATASGPVSFMDVWDATCKTIISAGTRRGAMMATLRCDHPDVMEFVTAKRDPHRLRNFNVSVLVTDDFMLAVRNNDRWHLKFNGEVYASVMAADLWAQIMRSAYEYAEPGVIFIDRINAANNLKAIETITATNPCGEQPLPPYGACLLGSQNLARFVRDAFSDRARIDFKLLHEMTWRAVRLLDNVVDVSRYPLQEQEGEARDKRRMGLGVTGLADALAMLRLRYNSDKGRQIASQCMQHIENAAYGASADLAKEKGPYPAWDHAEFVKTETAARLPANILGAIADNGLRNALLTSIAPTGTISLFAGNVSSGVEPIFALEYQRKVLQADQTKKTVTVRDYAYAQYVEMVGEGGKVPEYFVTAEDLTPDDHLAMQAAVQEFVDSSISKTVNVPEGWTFEEFSELYMKAWLMRLKGCTAYRPNDITGSVLSVEKPKPAEEPKPAAILEPRAAELEGKTYKIKWPESEHALYVTINDVINGSRRPYEIFINSKNMDHFAWTLALTRMLSAVFRRDKDVSFVVEELKAVFDPRGGCFYQGKYTPSLLAAIGDVIQRHIAGLTSDTPEIVPAVTEQREDVKRPSMRQCPKCQEFALLRAENCDSCTECDYSKCS